jgi:hypothetical protein
MNTLKLVSTIPKAPKAVDAVEVLVEGTLSLWLRSQNKQAKRVAVAVEKAARNTIRVRKVR